MFETDIDKKANNGFSRAEVHDLKKLDRVVTQMLLDGPALLNRALLLQRMREFGLANKPWGGLAKFQDWFNVSKVGTLQIPTELVDFLLYAAARKPDTVLEVGVFTGGTAVFSCAFFQALNPNVIYHCLDIKDSLLLLPETRARLNLKTHFGKTSDDFTGQPFDIVFIDGDHSFAWAKRDYLNLGRHARKVCAFHDIHAKEYLPKGGGIYTFWRQLRAALPLEVAMLEFAHSPLGVGVQKDGCWMGIGVLDYTHA